jgi:hypothetical protein
MQESSCRYGRPARTTGVRTPEEVPPDVDVLGPGAGHTGTRFFYR